MDAVACEGSSRRLIRPKGDAADGGCVFQNSEYPGVHTWYNFFALAGSHGWAGGVLILLYMPSVDGETKTFHEKSDLLTVDRSSIRSFIGYGVRVRSTTIPIPQMDNPIIYLYIYRVQQYTYIDRRPRWLGMLSSCLLKSISRVQFSPSAHICRYFFVHEKMISGKRESVS